MSLDVQNPRKEGSSVTPPHVTSMCSEEQLGRRKARQVTAAANQRLLPINDVQDWVLVVKSWTVEDTDDEENAAENLMMIQDCQARDANISRLQLVVKLD